MAVLEALWCANREKLRLAPHKMPPNERARCDRFSVAYYLGPISSMGALLMLSALGALLSSLDGMQLINKHHDLAKSKEGPASDMGEYLKGTIWCVGTVVFLLTAIAITSSRMVISLGRHCFGEDVIVGASLLANVAAMVLVSFALPRLFGALRFVESFGSRADSEYFLYLSNVSYRALCWALAVTVIQTAMLFVFTVAVVVLVLTRGWERYVSPVTERDKGGVTMVQMRYPESYSA